jgi:type 1 glutamine amidotransferase
MKHAIALLVLTLGLSSVQGAENKILVYTRNFVSSGKGYVHDNILHSVDAIKKMGAEKGFGVDVSDDPKVFTDGNLKQYKALVFSNSNNEAFDTDAQREAFRKYIDAGGGFVGIHSASGSERQWPYFWSLIGGKFLRHPKLQRFTISVADRDHAATRSLPRTFEWEDECYFLEFLNPDMHALLTVDPAKLDDPDRPKHPASLFGASMPLAWTLRVGGARQFYTALGHKKEHYRNPLFVGHLAGGILWAMGEAN